nr:unnamed protein product [Callosobruchus analis]
MLSSQTILPPYRTREGVKAMRPLPLSCPPWTPRYRLTSRRCPGSQVAATAASPSPSKGLPGGRGGTPPSTRTYWRTSIGRAPIPITMSGLGMRLTISNSSK